jgi:hypothetical protein
VKEEEKCTIKTYQGAVKHVKEWQEFAIQWNDSGMHSAISQAN